MLTFLGLGCDKKNDGAYADSIFWKIECAGKTSWLFGTMHAPNPVFENMPEPVEKAIAGSDVFFSEIELDGKNQMEVMRGMLLPDNESLELKIGRERFERLKAVTGSFITPIPPEQLSRQKIWAAALLIAWPRKPNDTAPADIILYQKAKERGCKTAGIETPEEQIGTISSFTEAEQIQMLDEAIEEAENNYTLLKTLMSKYIAQDLNGMADEFFAKNSSYSPEFKKKFIDRLLIGRNRLFLKRLLPAIKENSAFIAVGAGHLIGEEGLVSLLEKEGCKVTAVKIELEVLQF